MMKKLIILFFALQLFSNIFSQNQFKIKLIGYDSVNSLVAIYHFGKNMYVLDTLKKDINNQFQINESKIKQIELISVLNETNNIKWQIINDHKPTKINIYRKINFDSIASNSEMNQAWYEIQKLDYLSDVKFENFKELLKISETNGNLGMKKTIYEDITKTMHDRDSIFNQIVEKSGFKLLKSLQNLKYEFKFPSQIRGLDRKQQSLYVLNNYINYYDLDNKKIINAPNYMDRLEKFLQLSLNFGSDTSINKLDYFISRIESANDSSFYKIVCSDIVNFLSDNPNPFYEKTYIHVIRNYILNKKFYWTSNEDIEKFNSIANLLENNTIGNFAPDITFTLPDSTKMNLHSINAKFTLLVFWDPDCKVCQKSLPILNNIYKEYKEKGLEIVGICARKNSSYPLCWEYAKANGYGWIIGVDPYLESNYHMLYNVSNLPVIYLLEKNKIIINKKLKTDKLHDLLKFYLPN